MSHRAFAAVLLALGSLIASPAAVADQTITLDARLAQPVMKDGAAQKNYLRVALGGCRPEPNENRTPVNVAFVIDRSGSMAGDRIAQAREAAIMAIGRLGPDDIASVVVFDTRADVLVPAQKVTDPEYFIDRIRRIGIGGSTAIHDGVLKGRGEVLTYMDPRRLNRIVLLSDGQANVGPSRVEDFIRLGKALLHERISVSTIGLGLGYNEDLMLQLALASDGNHAFARDPSDLITIFNREFNDVLASCAQTVSIDIDLKPGVRAVQGGLARRDHRGEQGPVPHEPGLCRHRALRAAGGGVRQGTGGRRREQDFGIVKVAYTDARSGETQTLDTAIRGRFSASEEEVRAGADTKVGEVGAGAGRPGPRPRGRHPARQGPARAGAPAPAAERHRDQRLLVHHARRHPRHSSISASSTRRSALHRQRGAWPASSTQRKTLRELDANRAGPGRRY